MIETPTLPAHLSNQAAGSNSWLRYIWAGGAGASLGLAMARLLYESDPFQFMALGGLLPSLGLAALGFIIWIGLIWGMDRRSVPGQFPSAALLPMLITWFYILTPPMQVDPLRGAVLIAGGFLLSLALAAPWLIAPGGEIPAQHRWIGTVAIGLIALTAYSLTMQHTIGRADTFEFQVTAPVLGVAHPTGYPLYLMLGKLFSLFPLGKVATRVNATSVIAGTAAVMLLYLTLRRVFGLDRFISGLSALSFGLSPIFWSQTVIAEVYALHNAFVAAILGGALWLVVRFHNSKLVHDGASHSVLSQPGSPYPARVVKILFALVGLSLTNHLTTVLLIPSVVAALFLARPPMTRKQWLTAFGLFLAVLLIYAYIPIRWPALHNGSLMRFDEFVGWVTGSRFRGALILDAWFKDIERWRILDRLILDQYGWLGAALSLIGLALMIRLQWRAALVSGLAFAAFAFYGLNYYVPDVSVFLIPLFLIQAIWMGYGVATLIALAFTRYSLRVESWVHAALITLFALLPLSAAWTTGAKFDWSEEQALETWGRRVLDLPLEKNSVILADSEKIAPLEYLHRIEGLRPDMQMIVEGTEQEYRDYLNQSIAEGKTIYLARFLPGLEGTYSLRSVGPLIEVGTTRLSDAPETEGDSVDWINGITLLGAQTEDDSVHPGDEAWITLFWQAPDESLNNNYQVRLRLVDRGGQIYWQSLPAFPVSNRYPPVAWKSGEVVSDFYAIPMPFTLYPGIYTVEVALSPPFSPDLALTESNQEWVPAAEIEVRSSDAPLPITGKRLAVSFPEGALIGIDTQARAVLGGSAQIVATWLRQQANVQTEYTLPSDEDRAEFPILAEKSSLSVNASKNGDSVLWTIGGASVRCGWLQPLTQTCPLASMLVQEPTAQQAVANFDNTLLLTEVKFEAGRLQPGQNVDVTLTWQALRQIDEDYTVFIHLLGPDGLLHGQVDVWPVQGTFPTSEWKMGQTVEDRYLVQLDSNAPSGAYQLEIGVYLLATNTRLPVINLDALPIDDKVLLGGLIVPEP